MWYFAVLAIMMVICAVSCKKDPIIPPDPPPNTEISGEVNSVEQTIAVINGVVPLDAKQVGVCWDTISSPTVEKNQMAASPTNGKFSITISRLLPDKEYYARVYSNENGTYNYSANLPFKTKPASITVRTQPASSIGLHEAVLNGWLYIPEEKSITYWFEWGETTAYGNKTSEQTLTNAKSGSVNCVITGLDWHKVYHFRLGITADDKIQYGKDAQFLTLGDQPTIEGPMIIDNEQLGKITLSSIINPNLITTTVVFEWGKTTTYDHSITLDPITGSTGIEVSTEITVEQTQEYHFRVKAENVIGVTYGSDTSSMSLATIDADGNKYHACKIGNQIWLTTNWRVLKYNNGDPIPNITDPVAWGEQTTGALCFYNNDPANFAVYGPLYNWYVISDPRGICPPGWHVPSYDEWLALYNYLGGSGVGGKLKEAGFEHWYPENAFGTNSTGFTALPGGSRAAYKENPNPEEKGVFMGLHEITYFWTSESCPDPNSAWVIFIMGNNGGLWIYGGSYKYYGESLRLIKD